MNLLRATARSGGMYVGERGMPDCGPIAPSADGDVLLGARPEHVRIVAVDSPEALITGEVALVEHLGKEAQVHLDVDARIIAGDDSTFIATVDPADAPSPGETVGVGFDPSTVHIFDPETGEALRSG